MKDYKFLILLPYYERANLVRVALESVKSQNYQNWELFFLDDGSVNSAEAILKEVFPNNQNVEYKNTFDSTKEKLKRGGSLFGKYLNDYILISDSDVAIFLCDDDALYPDYLANLNKWFNSHPDEGYCYSHVQPYIPIENMTFAEIESYKTDRFPVDFFLNHTHDLYPAVKVDASQVAWKIEAFQEFGVRFNYPQTVSLDSHLYRQLAKFFGKCKFSGFKSQYKAVHDDQLTYRKRNKNIYDIHLM